jgi:hypothetical protein
MLFLMLQQCSTGFLHFAFEPLRFPIIFGGHDQSREQIDKPVVPERSDPVFRHQVFAIRAGHHERRILGKSGNGQGGFCKTVFYVLFSLFPGQPA